MSSVPPRQHCWLILVSSSAEETSKLIDELEHEDPQTFRQIPAIKLYRDRWRQGHLNEHDFLHRVKATIDNDIGVVVRQEARQFISNVLQDRRPH